MDYVESRRSMIKQKGFGLSMTHGVSMRPLIWGGRHCVAVSPLEGDPKPGDLLMFREVRGDREINIVHRLVDIKETAGGPVYITRGDNCLATETVSPHQIIGRVTEVHRLSGFRPWYVIPLRRFTVDDRAYRIYSRVWSATWPLRRVYYLLRAHANGLRVRLTRVFQRQRV
ncbi:MAG: hypothetical protein K2K84_03805 [Muribaculaceae bacterium]|nr:hypothetical protein [Muribaculaceae bacterium]